MKIVISIFAVFFAIKDVSAQMIFAPSSSTVIRSTADFAPTEDNGLISFKRNVEEGKYNWNKERYNITLFKYNDRMATVKKVAVSNGDYLFSTVPVKLINGNKKTWIIAALPGTEFNIGALTAMEIDPATLKVASTKTLVTEADISEKVKSSQLDKLNFKIKSSANKQYHWIFLDNSEGDFFIACLNANLEILSKSKQIMPGYEGSDISGMAVENDGSLVVTAVHKSVVGISRFTTENKALHGVLRFGENKPLYGEPVINPAGDLYYSGLLCRDSKFVSGVFLSKITPALTVEDIKTFDFPESIISQTSKDGFGKSKGIFVTDIKSRSVIQGDGSIKLIAECKTGLGKDFMQFTAAGTVIVADFSAPEKRFSIIPKYVVGSYVRNNADQYVLDVQKHSVMLFYYDNAENLESELSEPQKVLRGTDNAILMAATIDNSNTIKRKKVSEKGSLDLSENIRMFIMSNTRED